MGELLHVSHIQSGRLRGVLSVDIKDVATVEQLKKAISTQCELPSVDSLFYRGMSLDRYEQLALEYLIPDLRKIGPPRFSVRSILHNAGDFSLFVDMRDAGGGQFQVTLPAESTISTLIQVICDHEGGVHPSSFVLIVNGRRPHYDEYLEDYKLVSGDTVHCGPHLSGGGGPGSVDFVDMENTSALKTAKVVYNRDPKKPIWKCISRGLNIQGRCQNRHCESFGSKYVFCHIGFSIYNVAQVVHCPACKKQIKAITCGFTACKWMFEGRKLKPDGSSVDIMSSWKETDGDEYQWFDEAGGRNMAEWSNLVITVQKLNKYGKRKSRCSACFGDLEWASFARIVDRIVSVFFLHVVIEFIRTVLQNWGDAGTNLALRADLHGRNSTAL